MERNKEEGCREESERNNTRGGKSVEAGSIEEENMMELEDRISINKEQKESDTEEEERATQDELGPKKIRMVRVKGKMRFWEELNDKQKEITTAMEKEKYPKNHVGLKIVEATLTTSARSSK